MSEIVEYGDQALVPAGEQAKREIARKLDFTKRVRRMAAVWCLAAGVIMGVADGPEEIPQYYGALASAGAAIGSSYVERKRTKATVETIVSDYGDRSLNNTLIDIDGRDITDFAVREKINHQRYNLRFRTESNWKMDKSGSVATYAALLTGGAMIDGSLAARNAEIRLPAVGLAGAMLALGTTMLALDGLTIDNTKAGYLQQIDNLDGNFGSD